MSRSFNVAGPNKTEIHYTLDPESRLPELRRLIDQQNYFVVHAPRQSGKTTVLETMARKLTAEGRYTAIRFSIEASRPFSHNVIEAIKAIIDALRRSVKSLLPESLQPPDDLFQNIPNAATGLAHVLSEWAMRSSRPLVVFFDEIDAIEDDALIAVLHQLRDGYTYRPKNFPQSVVLIGMRDVREYRARIRPERESLGSASPFNIKTESFTLANFSLIEVTALYRLHTDETGQLWTDEAASCAYELTQGQPWLVNALARQIVERDVVDRSIAITATHVDTAKEKLILRRDTHLDSLAERLHEPRVRRIIEAVLTGSFTGAEVYNDDLLYVADLGLTTRPPASIRIANPIYAEVIPRTLSFVLQSNLSIEPEFYVMPDGRLDIAKLFSEFQQFYRRHSEVWLERYEYKEAGPHLILYAWLSRSCGMINGGGQINRESAIGTGRADLMIEWPVTTNLTLRRWPMPSGVALQREVVELKIYEDSGTEAEGLEQLGRYLSRAGESSGHLLIFDRRPERRWEEKIFRRDNVALPAPYESLRATVWGL